MEGSSTNSTISNATQVWCSDCESHAKEVEWKYKKNMDMLKRKVIFTDNLIMMCTNNKSQNENLLQEIKNLEKKCQEKDSENKLIQTQLKALLAGNNSEETEVLQKRVVELESVVEALEDKLKSMEMTHKMYEDKIHELKHEERNSKASNLKKFNSEKEQLCKQIKKMKKSVQQLEKENASLKKKNEVAREKLRKRRSSRGSQATDSEQNVSLMSEDSIRTEGEDVPEMSASSLKSPRSERKRKLSLKHRKSSIMETSDDEIAHENLPTSVTTQIEKSIEDDQTLVSESNKSPEVRETSVDGKDSDGEEPTSDVTPAHSASQSMVKQPVVTNSMKARMQLMKTKRAYRSFSHRPNPKQLQDMFSVVQHLRVDTSDALSKINEFCKQYSLLGHEKHVAKKMIKLHQEVLDSKVHAALLAISEGAVSSSNETDAESSDKSSSTSSRDQNRMKLPNEAERSLLGNTQANFITDVKSDKCNEVLKNAAVSLKKSDLVTLAEVHPNDGNNLEEPGPALDHSTTPAELDSKTLEAPEVLVTTNDKTSSMFSSDEEDTVVANILPVESRKSTTPPRTLDLPRHRIRTRSMNKSLSETSDSNSTFENVGTPKPDLTPVKSVCHPSVKSTRKNTSATKRKLISSEPVSGVRTRSMSTETGSEDGFVETSAFDGTRARKRKQSQTLDSPRSKDPDVKRARRNDGSDDNMQVVDCSGDVPAERDESLVRDQSVNLAKEKAGKRAARRKQRDASAFLETANHQRQSSSALSSAKEALTSVTDVADTLSESSRSDDADSKEPAAGTSDTLDRADTPSPKKTTSSDVEVDQLAENVAGTDAAPGTSKQTYGKLTSNDTGREDVKCESNSSSEATGCRDATPAAEQIIKDPPSPSTSSLPSLVVSDPVAVTKKNVDFSFTSETVSLTDDAEVVDIDVKSARSSNSDDLDTIMSEMSFAVTTLLSPIKATPVNETKEIALTSTSVVCPSDDSSTGNSSNNEEAQSDDDVDDSGRMSISPSANLCTALSFPATPKKTGVTAATNVPAIKNAAKKLCKQPAMKVVASCRVSKVKDTPRRFSCEAPVLARPVPSFKPVGKTKSFDPSLLGKQTKERDCDLSELARDSVEDENSLKSDDSADVEDLHKKDSQQRTWTHAASGPFKLVAPAVAAHTESQADGELTLSSTDAAAPSKDADKASSCDVTNQAELNRENVTAAEKRPVRDNKPRSPSAEEQNVHEICSEVASDQKENKLDKVPKSRGDVADKGEAVKDRDSTLMEVTATSSVDEISNPNEEVESVAENNRNTSDAMEVGSDDKQILSDAELTCKASDDKEDLVMAATEKMTSQTTELNGDVPTPEDVGRSSDEETEDKIKKIVMSLSIEEPLEALLSESPNKQIQESSASVVASKPARIKNEAFDENLAEIANAIQATVAVAPRATSFPSVSHSVVLDWICKLLPRTTEFVFEETLSSCLEALSESGGDPDLEMLLHKSEFFFVKMLKTASEIRQDGFLRNLILPVILKLFYRCGNGLPKHEEFFKDSETLNKLLPMLVKEQLLSAHTQSLVRIYGALCRLDGYVEGFMDLCRYCILSNGELEPFLYLCCLLPCWPSVITQSYVLTGKMLSLFLHLKTSAVVGVHRTKHTGTIKTKAELVKKLFGWYDMYRVINRWSSLSSVEKHWKPFLDDCIVKIKYATLVAERVDHGKDVAKLCVKSQDDVFRCLETLCLFKGLAFTCDHVIDGVFWPLLNQWSQHLAGGKDESDKPVTDACVVAVLKGLTTVLLVHITKNKILHPFHNVLHRAVSYFETMCALLQNFTVTYTAAPAAVQCATAASVIALSVCKAELAYSTLQAWLLATADPARDADQRGSHVGQKLITHRYLPLIVALHHEGNLARQVGWLELMVKRKRPIAKKSVTKLMWNN